MVPHFSIMVIGRTGKNLRCLSSCGALDKGNEKPRSPAHPPLSEHGHIAGHSLAVAQSADQRHRARMCARQRRELPLLDPLDYYRALAVRSRGRPVMQVNLLVKQE